MTVVTILRSNDVILHAVGAVIKMKIAVYDLLWRPRGELLNVDSAREEVVSLHVLCVVLSGDDGVANHLPVDIAKVVLCEPDGDRMYGT